MYEQNSTGDAALHAARALVRRVVVHQRSAGPRMDAAIRDQLIAMSAASLWDDDFLVEAVAERIAPLLRTTDRRRETVALRGAGTSRL